MTKEQIYVLVDTPDKCKRAYEILSGAAEPIQPGCEKYLQCELLDKGYPYLRYQAYNSWAVVNERRWGSVEISLDALAEMLGGEKEQDTIDSVIEKILEKNLNSSYDNGTISDGGIGGGEYAINAIKALLDQQTSALRKELGEKENTIRKQMDLTGAVEFGEWIAEKLKNSWFKHSWQGWYVPEKSKHFTTEELYNYFLNPTT